jgi:hypothetical protein
MNNVCKILKLNNLLTEGQTVFVSKLFEFLVKFLSKSVAISRPGYTRSSSVI